VGSGRGHRCRVAVGSEGAGTADALSDFDLFVVLADEVSLDGVEQRLDDFGDVLWRREVPYNAPAGGRYFSVGYPGPLQPASIDWYWQPHAHAVVARDTRILVEKQRLPRVPDATFETFPNVRDAVPYQQPDDPRERLEGVLRWFWLMFGPLSKKVARRQRDQLLEQGPLLDGAVALAASYAGRRHEPLAATGQVADLRALAERMLEIHPALDIAVPEEDTRAALAMIAAAEGLVAEGWTPSSARTRDPQ